MPKDQFRYFIQLQNFMDGSLPRSRAQELQRQQADDVMRVLGEWLADNQLQHKVRAIQATLFGQIQITCTQDVIQRLRQMDLAAIALIRQGGITEQFNRWGESRGG